MNVPPRTRKRSLVACDSCRLRRVRCSVSRTGPPCSNCSHDDIECRVHTAKPGNIRRQRPFQEQSRSSAWATNSIDLNTPIAIDVGRTYFSLQSGSPCLLPEASTRHTGTAQNAKPISEDSMEHHTNNMGPSDGHDIRHSPSNVDLAYQVAFGDTTNTDAVPYYVGEPQGLNFILDICMPDRPMKGNHYPIPQVNSTDHAPSESATSPILSNIFSISSNDISQDFLRSYFQYVHPNMPIVHASSFLAEYTRDQARSLSRLLLWSVFFAASSYVSVGTLELIGYKTRKDLKRVLYKQAKNLYDANCEPNKITLIQSVLLMSFWYNDTDDRMDCWHWNGVALSLCHSAGLHRDPANGHSWAGAFSDSRVSIWRRIWWACYVREVWLSLGYGRPMRINLDDCSTPSPSVADMLIDLKNISQEQRSVCFSDDCEILAPLYIRYVEISITLGAILIRHYRPRKALPLAAEIEADEKDIRDHAGRSIQPSELSSINVQLHWIHLKLCYEAASIVLHRPYLMRLAGDLTPSERDGWNARNLAKTKAAASKATTLVNELIDINSVRYASPGLITLIKPAMQIYLLDSISPSSLTRRHAVYHLDLYMLVLSEMRDMFWTANVNFDLFQKAREKLEYRDRNGDPTPSARSTREDLTIPSPEPGVVCSTERQETPPEHTLTEPQVFGDSPFTNLQHCSGLDVIDINWDLTMESILTSEGFNFAP